MYFSDKGFWISPDGTEYEIIEHFDFVKKNPELFGFTKEEVEKLRHDKHRGYLLAEAMKRGWIRIRERKGETSIELWELTQSALQRILGFLKNQGYWESDRIFLSILKNNRAIHLIVEELKKKRRVA